jgi:putative transposase
VGTLELRVPQDRQGRFNTEIFSRDQRSEKALVAALVAMFVQSASTRKIKAISDLDAELERFARQRPEAERPYLILDARYEKVREDRVIRSRALLVAIGIDWEVRHRILGVELVSPRSS